MVFTFQREIGGKLLTIETGKLAGQANGSVTVRYGDSVVLVTACASPQPREGIDFFPLTVDYEERLYAAGKIPGSFFRREGRPSQEAILAMRLTDRPLRPLFPKGFRNDVQVIITVLSADRENDPDILAIVGASAALSISDIPFLGPVGASRLGYIDGKLVINPTFSQLNQSSLDFVVAGTKDAVLMVEAGASELDESIMLDALRLGQETNQLLIGLQEEMVAKIGKAKMKFEPGISLSPELERAVESVVADRLGKALEIASQMEREQALSALKKEVVAQLAEKYSSAAVEGAFEDKTRIEVRGRILSQGRRPDGRSTKEIRSIQCEVGVLPRTHGSGLFTRGETQVLTITTLGSPGEEQELDGISPEEKRRFIHHYNFPPFSTGEVRRMGGPGRREIGHGALAERALVPVIPSKEQFPYTIRLVSEVLSSNGSTSMASVCGSTLSLMDAGVPISAPVAGVAMGLIIEQADRYAILTDIAGIEDHLGDMDFKVAGTAKGINALQLDVKVAGVNPNIMEEALEQARLARLFVLTKMAQALPSNRSELSPYAPRMYRMKINREKIGAVIGPGGKTIRSIIEETKATVEVEDDGTVIIGSPNEEAAHRAMQMIENLTREVHVGDIFTGKVTRTTSFGAFVEVLPGKDGLIHISELADYRVPAVEDVVKVGDEVMVVVREIDSMGRINLSRKAVYSPQQNSQPGEPSLAGTPPQASDGGAANRQDSRPSSPPRYNGGPDRRSPYPPRRGDMGRPGGDRRPGGGGGWPRR